MNLRRRGAIKPFVLNQKRIAGIGNVYVQDPLFKAGIHPLRRINTLSDDKVTALWQALQETLQESIDHGGSAWELNLYGEKGGWGEHFLLVGYREGEPCPKCGTVSKRHSIGRRRLREVGISAPTVLEVTYSKHYCVNCRKHFSLPMDHLAQPSGRFTNRVRRTAVDLVVKQSIKRAIQYGLDLSRHV